MTAPGPVRQPAARRPTARRLPRARDDDGTVMLLSIGLVVTCLLLVTVVASASAVHLERKRLLGLADTTAVAAASAMDETVYFRNAFPDGHEHGTVYLTDADVRTAVETHLGATPVAAGFTDLAVVVASATDTRTAEVTLSARAVPPFLSWVLEPWTGGFTITATASARAW